MQQDACIAGCGAKRGTAAVLGDLSVSNNARGGLGGLAPRCTTLLTASPAAFGRVVHGAAPHTMGLRASPAALGRAARGAALRACMRTASWEGCTRRCIARLHGHCVYSGAWEGCTRRGAACLHVHGFPSGAWEGSTLRYACILIASSAACGKNFMLHCRVGGGKVRTQCAVGFDTDLARKRGTGVGQVWGGEGQGLEAAAC